MIPMVNLKAQYAEIKEEVERGLAETIESCAFILGPLAISASNMR
jgi:hypothetical protein